MPNTLAHNHFVHKGLQSVLFVPTVGGIYEHEGPMQMFSGEHLIVDDSQINQSCGVEIIVFVDEKEEVVVGNESFWVGTR